MKQQKARSPLERMPPLRAPGQSLTDEIDDLRYDQLLAPLMVALLMVVIATLEWWRYWTHAKPSPWIYTAGAALFCVYAAVKVRRGRRKLRQLQLGRDGERAVAEHLEWLRQSNFVVVHDVPNGDANVDHVLIGPQGVSRSKPRRFPSRRAAIARCP